jgi:hypothetical protein
MAPDGLTGSMRQRIILHADPDAFFAQEICG